MGTVPTLQEGSTAASDPPSGPVDGSPRINDHNTGHNLGVPDQSRANDPRIACCVRAHSWSREEIGMKRFIPIGEVWDMDLREPAFLVDGLLPEIGLTILYGDKGAGKSAACSQLALSAAHGTPFLGRPIEHTARVLLTDEEEPLGSMRTRLRDQIRQPRRAA
jgi:AAA domain